MFSHQKVELFERIRRIRKCGPVGQSMSLGMGFEVSKAYKRPTLLFDLQIKIQLSAAAPVPATMVPTRMIMD